MSTHIRVTDEVYTMGRSMMAYDDTWSSFLLRLMTQEPTDTLKPKKSSRPPHADKPVAGYKVDDYEDPVVTTVLFKDGTEEIVTGWDPR